MVARSARSWLVPAAVAAGVAAALAWAMRPEPVRVDVRTVARGRLAVRVGDEGVTRIRERYVVSAPLAGRMSRVELHAGDAVRQGETLIATIDPTDPALLDPRAEAEAKARVATAVAARQYAEHAIHRAKVVERYAVADLARARELFPVKAITKDELEAAERDWQTAVEDVEEAEQELNVAEQVVGWMEAAMLRTQRRDGPAVGSPEWRMELEAPLDGRVLRVFRESEGVVDAATDIVELGDPTDLEVVVDLVSEDAVKVEPGDRAELTAWGGGTPLEARVRVVEPRGFTKVSPLGVEEQRVNVILDLVTPPDDRKSLGDGFRIEAAITVDEVADAVLVPLAALFHRSEGEAVFVVDADRARLVPVTTGRRGDRDAEVLAGLSGGETVIAYPGDAIAAGTRVTVRD